MKRTFTRLGLILPAIIFCLSANSQTHLPKHITVPGIGSMGFYEFRPANYGNQLHPLIIFLHGAGETGDGSNTDLLNLLHAGIPRLIAAGATMKFGNNSFVVLSPQTSNNNNFNPAGGGSYWKVHAMLQYAKDSLHIDSTRIYITGLSMGGGGVWNTIFYDTNDIKQIAAAAPISALRPFPESGYCNAARYNIPIWAFHNDGDDNGQTQPGQTTKYVLAQINACTSPSITDTPKVTYYNQFGHDAWDNAYDTGHHTYALSTDPGLVSVNGSQATINLYEWLLLHTNNHNTTPPVNQPPVANAGIDITINLPVDSVILNGSGSHDADGTITTYAWSKISGGSATIASPSGVSTHVSGLVQGVYTFQLTVTDNNGATGSDTVQVTVDSTVSSPYYGMDSLQLMGRYALVKRPVEDPAYTSTKKYPLIIEIPDQSEYADQAPAGVTALFNSGTPKLLKSGINIYPNDQYGNPIYYIAVKYQPGAYGDLTVPDGFTNMWDTIMARYPIDTTKDNNGKYRYVMLVGIEKGGATVFNFTNWNASMDYGGAGSYRAINLKKIVTSRSHDLQSNDSRLYSQSAFARLSNKRLRFFEATPPANGAQRIYDSAVAVSNAVVIKFNLSGLTNSQIVDSLFSPYGIDSITNIYKMLVDDSSTVTLSSSSPVKTGVGEAFALDNDKTILVYPNPARDMAQVITSRGVRSVGLYSITGQRLAFYTQDGGMEQTIRINTGNLAPGIYMLHIKGEDGAIRIVKLMKQ